MFRQTVSSRCHTMQRPNQEEALYRTGGRTLITDEFQGRAVAVLTASEKPRVLAAEYRMVDSR